MLNSLRWVLSAFDLIALERNCGYHEACAALLTNGLPNIKLKMLLETRNVIPFFWWFISLDDFVSCVSHEWVGQNTGQLAHVCRFSYVQTRLRLGQLACVGSQQTYVNDGAYYWYCPYVLLISRYSDFLSPMLTNTGIFLRGLKLSGERRS